MNGTRAFSLVEVVLALGVIGFALVAVIGLLPIGLQSGRASIQETRANHLADEIFATVRSQPFNAISLATLQNTTVVDLSAAGNAPVSLYATYDGSFVGTPDYFTIAVSFQNPPQGLIAGAANEVHLRITSRDNATQPLSYATIIAAQ